MARQEKKYNYIYKITCVITNRYYIGMHSTNNLDDGYMGSGKRLWFSINYHGKENHKKEILEWLPTRRELKDREKEIVCEELLDDTMCMNLQLGGGGGFIDEEHKTKVIACLKEMNKIHSHKGGLRTQELIRTDLEFKKRQTEKISNGLKDNKNFLNRKHSDETKKIMSEKAKQHIGDKNSQYGTCWITKNNINKKIKKEDLAIWIDEGWIQGRK